MTIALTTAEQKKTELRRIIRTKRRALSGAEQRQASQKLLHKLSHLPIFKKSFLATPQTLAFYIANDGEISPDLVINLAKRNFAKMNKGQVLLPCVTSNKKLKFRVYSNQGSLTKNRYGIPEPQPRCAEVSGDKIDVVFMPLVAFDGKGNRLGMGGGFYDRTFAYKAKHPNKAPLLVGLAHECQMVNTLDVDLWDIPLDYIVTDKRVIRPGH